MSRCNESSLCVELLKLPQFVLWKKENRNNQSKPTKVPYCPETRAKASVGNSSDWSNYSDATFLSLVYDDENNFSGIGFVLTEKDPFFFIDLDNCVDNGKILPWAEEILNLFPTYWEFSPSKKGLHGYGIGKIPEKYLSGKKTGRRKGSIEIYDKGRFFTFTEDPLPNTNRISDCQEQLEKFMADNFSESKISDVKVVGDLEEILQVPVDRLMENLGINDQILNDWIINSKAPDKSSSGKDSTIALELLKLNRDIQDVELMSLIRYRRIRDEDNIKKANRLGYLHGVVKFARSCVPSGEEEFSPVDTTNIAQNDNWLEPYDIFGDYKITGEAKLEKDMLPSAISEYAFDCAERMGVSPEMVGLPCLVVAASLIHDGFRIQPKIFDTDWIESARLWTAIVADPGCKKTPAISASLKPLKQLEKKWDESNRKKIKEYLVKKKTYDQKLKNPEFATEQEPEKPVLKRVIINDATVESLGNILADNPSGILSVHDELVSLLSSMDAYKNNKSGKDRSAWLELYNGGMHTIDRVAKEKSIRVPNWSASVIGGIQPEKLQAIASDLTDDGLLQRFMVIFGKNIGDEIDREPNIEAYEKYFNVLEKLSSLDPTEFNSLITLSKAAQQHREEVSIVVKNVMMLPETIGAMKGHLLKWDGLYARLLLAFHFIEHAIDGNFAQEVSEQNAKKVKELMLRVLLPNAAKFYRDLVGKGKCDNHVKWIAGYIISAEEKEISERAIRRKYGELRNVDYRTILMAMTTLEAFGWVKPHNNLNGKPTTKWHVNPIVHSRFAKQALEERKRRDAVKQKIQQAAEDLRMKKILK